MLFTVVTVCYQAAESIGGTIQSLLKQTSGDYEYIIKDGGSEDKTLEIAESFRKRFEEKKLPFRIISQKDSGIYDAMNRAIDEAEGNYIYFLNAGDLFHQDDVLERIGFFAKERHDADILYGDVLFVDRGFCEIRKANHLDLKDGMTICHQGMFTKTALLKKNPFNLAYRVSADYDFTLGIFQNGGSFVYTGITVANYFGDGVSTLQMRKTIKEHEMIRKAYGLPDHQRENEIFIRKCEMTNKIKRVLPDCLWKVWCVKIKKRTEYRYHSEESENKTV